MIVLTRINVLPTGWLPYGGPFSRLTPKGSLPTSTKHASTHRELASQRPAVDIGLSVSRVGDKAQSHTLKAVAGRVRLNYARYLELLMFLRFGGFNGEALQQRLVRGERNGALLAQGRLPPFRPIDQVALLVALESSILDKASLQSVTAMKLQLPTVIDSEPRLSTFDPSQGELTDGYRAFLTACVSQALAAVTGLPPSRRHDKGSCRHQRPHR